MIKKIAHTIVIEENETRYDSHMEIHGHFKCEKCGTIYDIKVDDKVSEIKSLDKFQIDKQHIYYKGICNKCLQKIVKFDLEKTCLELRFDIYKILKTQEEIMKLTIEKIKVILITSGILVFIASILFANNLTPIKVNSNRKLR